MPSVLSLDKSLDILEVVANQPEGVGTRALSKLVRINLTTVHNIAGTLKRRGYLWQDPHSKRFLLGTQLMLLARRTDLSSTMTEAAMPFVRRTAALLGESVMLAALVNSRIMRLAYMPSPQALCAQEPDDLGPNAYCTACGKVLLAAMPAHTLEAYFEETPLVRYTKQTRATQKLIRAEIDQIRKAGFATTRDELCDGVSAVAVSLSDPWRNVVAALGTGIPTSRFSTKRRDQALAILQKQAALITHAWWSQGKSRPSTPGEQS